MVKRKFSRAEFAVACLLVTLAGCAWALFNQEQLAQERVLLRTVENARVLSNFATHAHEQYTASTMDAVRRNDLKQSTDLDRDPQAIHFPMSFSRHLTNQFSRKYPNVHFGISSDHPFEIDGKRKHANGFELEALLKFRKNESEEYWRVEELSDTLTRVHHATPIIMREQCAACHNNPKWGLEKQDWKPGDIRAVRSVVLDLPTDPAQSARHSYTIWAFIALSCAMGALLVYPSVRKEVSQRVELEKLSNTLGDHARELKVQSTTDVQTGLRNRRYFDEALQAYLDEFGNNGLSVGLVVFDLDHFKSINDTYGHQAGDFLIESFGILIQQHLRQHDFAARIGGEEFAIVVPNSSREDVLAIAERVVECVAAQEVNIGAHNVRVTVSAGLAISRPGELFETFTARADRNLYKAKNSGRNRAVG